MIKKKTLLKIHELIITANKGYEKKYYDIFITFRSLTQ